MSQLNIPDHLEYCSGAALCRLATHLGVAGAERMSRDALIELLLQVRELWKIPKCAGYNG